MSNPTHLLAQQITGKTTLEECSLAELQQTARRYPYFAPAQFLLLQKLRQLGLTNEADTQYKKAVLFYPDPVAFELFISSGKFFGADEPLLQEEAKEFDRINDTDKKEVATNDRTADEHSLPAGTIDFSTEAVLTRDGHSAKHVAIEKQPDDTPPITEKDKAVEAVFAEAEIVASPVSESDPIPLPEIKTDEPQREAVNEPLAFEPYHTVDYFASQGIKISQEELPKDKLGKQLKSFTAWLKEMKRLPASQTASTAESPAEKGVETMASRSVSESEVLTEAMAEVWAKQGAHQKALDIYNKLSLHNPSKRDYFAAKIENLKPF